MSQVFEDDLLPYRRELPHAIEAEEYLAYLNRQEIPPRPPKGTSPDDFRFLPSAEKSINYFRVRDECNSLGMWPVVDKIWTKQLADWIDDRKVLEVMSGAGWLAKALHENDIHITATDDFSWGNGQHKGMKLVHEVQKKDAISAVKEIEADLLLISWPPYDDKTILKICDHWGTDRPIIYIGERGGCNAPEDFEDHFEDIENHPTVDLMCWFGIHDHVCIGHWTNSAAIGDK